MSMDEHLAGRHAGDTGPGGAAVGELKALFSLRFTHER